MLADHLDAVLAAGEDLVARGADWRSLLEMPGIIQSFARRQRDIAEDVRGLELILMARLLKARDHAKALAQMDTRFEAVARLFVSGTAILLEAVEESGDATAEDFETGDGLVAYLRGRGLITAQARALANSDELVIDDNFLVAKRTPLGPLLDMSAAFLDALDIHYELYAEEDEDEAGDEDQRPMFAKSRAARTRERTPASLSERIKSVTSRKEFGKRDRTPLN